MFTVGKATAPLAAGSAMIVKPPEVLSDVDTSARQQNLGEPLSFTQEKKTTYSTEDASLRQICNTSDADAAKRP
jgi:hypothetical protein